MMEGNDPARVPRTIEVELTEDQVDCCVPGDVITVCGVVKVAGTQTKTYKKGGQSLYVCYIDSNSLGNSKQGDTGKLELLQFSLKDIKAIQKIIMAPDVFGLIVKSICPSIYGNHLVKAGLALALFGGTQKVTSNNNKLSVRGDIHVLLVGDPGLGKSQLLKALCDIAPRGVYVCGSYSTTTGLTVTLLRDPGTGDFAIEAGALVLGDQGICCIDEFDKMKHEHPALLEAMEQQSVSIAKAGIVCNLPARTCVIAAANPVGGHYDKSRTVSENIKMSTALLSRFDLIFILLDRPDEQRDQLLSSHVISLHSKNINGKIDKGFKDDIMPDTNEDGDLLQRLLRVPEKPSVIPAALLRKYIGYAKKYCPSPTLSEEACHVIQEFYISLREKKSTQDYTPITTRQLESMIRLSESRARLELRDVVTKQDAEDVVQIMRQSLKEAFEDDIQCFDFRKSATMSKKKLQTAFISILTEKSKKSYTRDFSAAELRKIALDAKLNVPNFDEFLELLNFHNFLLKKGPQMYQLQTV
uniref:DNA helicase n=1 Tax=Arcella intermedia TaxID=1963864 RepID=A0A6B2L1S0_9EUKA